MASPISLRSALVRFRNCSSNSFSTLAFSEGFEVSAEGVELSGFPGFRGLFMGALFEGFKFAGGNSIFPCRVVGGLHSHRTQRDDFSVHHDSDVIPRKARRNNADKLARALVGVRVVMLMAGMCRCCV